MAKKTNPTPYTAPHDVYVDSKYYKAGELFVTGAPKGEKWEEQKPADAKAIDASTRDFPADPPLENLSVGALQAIATEHKVDTSGIERNKKALITAIKAADEPKL